MKGSEVFGATIRRQRRLRSWSQEELSFRTGLHRNHIGAIERGEGNPTIRTIQMVADALDVTVSWLFANAEHDQRQQDGATA